MNNISNVQALQRKPQSQFDQPPWLNQTQTVISNTASQSSKSVQKVEKEQNKKQDVMRQQQVIALITPEVGNTQNSRINQQRPAQITQVNEEHPQVQLTNSDCLRLIKYHENQSQKLQIMLVHRYDQTQNWTMKTILITSGLNNVRQSILLLNYQTCNGKLCELCRQSEERMGVVYMIVVNGYLHFLHALCVHNSKQFQISDKGTITNFSEAMNIYKSQECRLCGLLNASVQCAGINQDIRCEHKYHVHCLFNSTKFGKTTPADQSFICKKHMKIQLSIRNDRNINQQNNQQNHQQNISQNYQQNHPVNNQNREQIPISRKKPNVGQAIQIKPQMICQTIQTSPLAIQTQQSNQFAQVFNLQSLNLRNILGKY